MLKVKKIKSVFTFLLVLTMVVCMSGISVQAAGMTSAEKTAIKQENDTYEVKIEIPGKDGNNQHDEVILMVDGSYSMDNEWPAMKEAINTIGATVLNGSGNTQLTLMAFGMGDNEVLVHIKDADELAAALGELPGNLLYGRSSTNCEAGFTGVAEYIENHDNTLRDVNVIFISDGNLNTDETLRAFDTNWRMYSTQFGALTVAQAAFEGALAYGENLPAAFNTVFGDRFADADDIEEILNRAFDSGEVTEEEFFAFADQIWEDVYAYSGLTVGKEYPISDVERAFVKYDKEKGTYIQDAFYYSTYKSSYVTYPDRWTRTPLAADALAAMEEVKSMYVVDYDGYTSWMDTGIQSEKSKFIKSNGIAGLCEALADALTDLSKTPFNNVVTTDYMSKWVNLDVDSIKIVDNSTGQVIWNRKEGWKIDENRPTAVENPVEVEVVTKEEYEAGGADVIGNSSGDIYKLTWHVKDGALLLSDSYALVYNVTVDTEEKGFVLEQLYPSNGNTYMEYEDEDGEKQKDDIDVPFVSYAERIINLTKSTKITKGDKVVLYPLEGIKFDIYYVCTVDEYTDNLSKYATPGLNVLDNKIPITTIETDITGKATYNLTQNGQPDGIYLIVEKEHPAIAEVLDPFYVAVPMTKEDGTGLIYSVDLHPKNTVITPDIKKDVTEIENNTDTVDVGEEFTWIIRGDIPTDITNAKNYEIIDVLDQRLTYAGDLVVKVEEITAEADNSSAYKGALTIGTDYILTKSGETQNDGDDIAEEKVNKIEVKLTEDGMKKIARMVGEDSEKYELRVYFNTIINENATVGADIPNQAVLKYTNSANFAFEVESDEPFVYTCGINIKKYDAKNTSKYLAGAEFKVARKATTEEIADENIATTNLVIGNGVTAEVVYVDFYNNAELAGSKVNTVTTDGNGDAMIYGLKQLFAADEEGNEDGVKTANYYLIETKAPEGYNLLSYPVEITLNKVSHVDTNTVQVANSNTFKLPETGGMGTTIFTMSGMMMLAAAAFILIMKKKENA